jgi:hypothetical protein
MTTQKETIKKLKSNKITVFAFDKNTNARTMCIGGCDIVRALQEAMRHTSLGHTVLFVNYEKHGMLTRLEINKGVRLLHSDVLPYSMDKLV